MFRPWQRAHVACTCSRPAPSANWTGGGPPWRAGRGGAALPTRGCLLSQCGRRNADARNATSARQKVVAVPYFLPSETASQRICGCYT